MRKNAPGFEFLPILCFTPLLRRPLWVATLTCSGRTGASNHKCLGALESSTNQPSGQPVGGWGGGKNLPKLERGQLFGPLKGGRWITAGDCSPIVGMPRYRFGSPIDTANHFDWLAPLGSASKNSSKLEFWALFPPTGPAKHASERTPFPPKLGHRTASRRAGEGGGGGRKRPKL